MGQENAALKADKRHEDDDDEEDSKGSILRLVESRSDKKREREDEDRSKTPWEFFNKPPKTVETASKAEVPVEGVVSDNEKQMATSALAEEEARAAPENTDEDVVAKEFLERVAETGDIEAAAADTLAEIDATPEEVKEVMKASDEPPGETEPEDEAEAEAKETAEAAPEEIVFDRAAEAGQDETDEEAPGGAGGGTVPPVQPPVAHGGHGAGGVPPHGPQPPLGPGSPAGFSAPIPTSSGNIYNAPITPASSYAERYDQGNPAVTALIGGIIGYMIGRRRGRIKAEKRLIPIQKKLEKQVDDLHWQIKSKEKAIRKVAAEKSRNDGALVIEKVASSRAARAAEKAKSVPAERAQSSRRAAPEASLLHSDTTHEHLGHMLVTAEAARQKRPKQPEQIRTSKNETNRLEHIPEHLRTRNVETLNRTDLLALSERIIVDGTSLRQIYETHLIGERGLRRLIVEHLRGGDVKKILRREIVEHEIDFERDPVLRDLPADSSQAKPSASATASKQTLNQLFEQASAGLGGETDALAYYKARAAYEAQEQQEQSDHRRLVDVGFGIVITALVAVILILYVMRH